MAGGVRKLVEEFNRAEKKQKRAKHNRTLSLDTQYFVALQEYCKERGISVSEVIDRLMEEFLTEALNATPEEPISMNQTATKKVS